MNRVAIIGLGMIGASFACACKEFDASIEILGIDSSYETLEIALSKGWVNTAALPTDDALCDFVNEGCDLVLLAIPVDFAGEYFEKLATWGYAGIISDTASTKGRICAMAEGILPEPAIFIPGHPMAGSEINRCSVAPIGFFARMTEPLSPRIWSFTIC